MKAEFKTKFIRLFLIIVLTVLFCNSVFLLAITGDVMALVPVAFHIVIAILLFNKSKYLPMGLMVWGAMIIVTGLYKIVVQTLVSFEDLISNPYHLIKAVLLVVGIIIYRIGSRELDSIMKTDSESK